MANTDNAHQDAKHIWTITINYGVRMNKNSSVQSDQTTLTDFDGDFMQSRNGEQTSKKDHKVRTSETLYLTLFFFLSYHDFYISCQLKEQCCS